MKNLKRIKKRSYFFLISFLFLLGLVSLRTLKKIDIQDIKISGSELFSQDDVVNNSSLKFPIRLIFIKNKFLEKELKQNLSLKNISVSRQILPFGLKVHFKTRTPIAFGERILNNDRIIGFIDNGTCAPYAITALIFVTEDLRPICLQISIIGPLSVKTTCGSYKFGSRLAAKVTILTGAPPIPAPECINKTKEVLNASNQNL